MNTHGFRIILLWIGVVSLAFTIQGCGGKNGGSSATATPPVIGPTITGTAAMGAPIPNASITVKDQNGTSKTGETDDNGRYSIDVTGMTPPFLLKVDPASGTSLFSVGMQRGGIVNIHPFTNLMIGIWYQLKGLNVEAAFATMTSTTPVPSAIEVSSLSRILNNIFHPWLSNQGLDPKTFDFITTPFDANGAGFDAILALSHIDTSGAVTIQDSNTKQTFSLSLDLLTSTVSVNTTITTGQQVKNTITSFVIPTTPELQTALNGVNAALLNVVATAKAKGPLLADTDLAGYFDDSYLQDGFGKNVGPAELATLLRGVAQTLQSFTVYRIVSYDNTKKTIQVVSIFSWTQNGETLLRMVDKGSGGGLYFRLQADGSWRLFGDQQIASVSAQGITVQDMGADSNNVISQNFQLQVIAPTGTLLDSVQATVGTTNYPLTKWTTVLMDTVYPNVTGPPTIVQKDVFTYVQDITQNNPSPSLGIAAVFTLTSMNNQILTYTDTLKATTTEAIQITEPVGHTLGDANLGQPLTVDWTLPTSFQIGRVELTGLVTAGGSACNVYSRVLGPSATSGTITLPSKCNGGDVSSVNPSAPDPALIQVSVWGVNAEQTQVQYHFR